MDKAESGERLVALEGSDVREVESAGKAAGGAAAYLQFIVDTKRADMVVDLDGLAKAIRALITPQKEDGK